MRRAAKPPSAAQEDRSGLIAGLAAFTTWGLIPVYWKLLSNGPATQILAHRFVWTTAFLVALLSWQQRWPEVRDATRSRRALLYCFASGVAISVNWFFFIWAVNAGRVIETTFLGEASEHVLLVKDQKLKVISAPPLFTAPAELAVEFDPADVVILSE